MHFIKSKTILGKNNNINLYRGCSFGCIYCDARSSCYHVDNFEDIGVKENAIKILDKELASKKVPVLITTGAMSDPYCKLEETLGVTRKMLELFIKYRCGVMFLTKSTLALRDLDLYKKINEQAKVLASFTITCFDDTLREKIEPYSSSTKDRFMALKKFHEAGIETCIWLCPILPFITDTIENISNIVDKCYEVGVTNIILWDFGTTMREGSRDYFYKNLDKYFPGYKKMYQDTYKNSYVCQSLKNDELMKVFKDKCHKYGIKYDINQIYKIQEQEMQKNLEKTDFNLFNMDK